MVGSMFAAIAGLKAHQSKMDTIGNNIANVNTWGYKAQSVNFMDAMYRNKIVGKAGAGAVGGAAATGGKNTSQVGYGVNVGSITVNYGTGNWSPTGIDTNCLINGPGFFMVSKTLPAAGSVITNGVVNPASGVLLSRVGILGFDNQGYLVDEQGNFVLGADGNAIQCADVLSSVTIKADGSITGVKESDNSIVDVGQLGVASVQNVNGLEHTEGYYFQIGDNAGTVNGGATTKASGDIMSGYLEMSNTDLSTEMASMITTQRGYQANTKMITVTDEMLEQLVNMKR